MTKAEIIRYCRDTLKEIDEDLPKYYVRDVVNLAREAQIDINPSPDKIRKVRLGITPDKKIVDLLKIVAVRNREASIMENSTN